MVNAEILFAIQDGICFLKLAGDITYSTSTGISAFVERALNEGTIENVLIDLTHVRYIDSTNLGELAKIASLLDKRFSRKGTILTTNPDVTGTISCMGLDRVYIVASDAISFARELGTLPLAEQSQAEKALTILEAHRHLVMLNEQNSKIFKNVVEALEKDIQKDAGGETRFG
jgi:anti-anti-sigma factor